VLACVSRWYCCTSLFASGSGARGGSGTSVCSFRGCGAVKSG